MIDNQQKQGIPMNIGEAVKKLCDGLGITIEDFFRSDLFRGLEQEIK